MRSISLLTTLVGAVVFGACQSAAPISISKNAPTSSDKTIAIKTPTPDPHEEEMANAPRISLQDAKAAFDAKEAAIVDSRSPSAYEIEHIATAINIPLLAPEGDYAKIPKGKKIIIYCS